MELNREKLKRMFEDTKGTSGSTNSGGGGGSLAGYATQAWVNEGFVSIEFFNRLFTVYGPGATSSDPDVVIEPNDLDSTIKNIKAMFGLWTEQYLSALGLNPGGTGSDTSLSMLDDVNITTPTSGQALVYNATSLKWENQTIQVGGDYLPLTGGTMTGGNISWDTDNHGVYFRFGCGIEKYSNYGPSLVAETGTTFEISSRENRAVRYTILHTGNVKTVNGQSIFGSGDINVGGGGGSYLPLAGGTMTGNINSVDIYPIRTNAQYLGSAQKEYHAVFTRFLNSASSQDLYIAAANGDNDILITSSHQVGIGGRPSYKLHVMGSLYTTQAAQFANVRIGGPNMNAADTDGCIELLTGTGYIDWHYNGNSGDYTLRLIERSSGVLTCDGSFYATGAITALSDVRYKDIQDHITIDNDAVANAPVIRFLWKDRKNNDGLHVGSIAQYWEKVLPEAVKRDKEGTLSMSYGVVALVAAVSTAKKVQEHERRIADLECENKKLKGQLIRLNRYG